MMAPPIASTATARLSQRHQQRHPSLVVQAIALSGNSLDSCRHKLVVWRACELIAVSKRRKLIRRYARTRAILIIQAKAIRYRNMARQHSVGHLDANHRRPNRSYNPRLVARFNTKACSVIWLIPWTHRGLCGASRSHDKWYLRCSRDAHPRSRQRGTLTLTDQLDPPRGH